MALLLLLLLQPAPLPRRAVPAAAAGDAAGPGAARGAASPALSRTAPAAQPWTPCAHLRALLAVPFVLWDFLQIRAVRVPAPVAACDKRRQAQSLRPLNPAPMAIRHLLTVFSPLNRQAQQPWECLTVAEDEAVLVAAQAAALAEDAVHGVVLIVIAAKVLVSLCVWPLRSSQALLCQDRNILCD